MITFKDYNPANPWQVTGESQTVSLTGKVVLNYIPLKGSITITGYTETTSQSPGLTEFYVDYQDSTAYRTAKGILQFNVAAAGAVVSVKYKGVSTMIWAAVMNEIKAFMESYGLSGVIAGTYQLGNYAVNSQGRITAVESLTPGIKNKLINGDFSIWQRGANAIPTTLRARTSNVATITTDRPHGYVTGDTVQITGLADSVANVTATLTAVTSTTFSFANTGPDVGSVADTGGRCLIMSRPSFAIAAGAAVYTADRKIVTNNTDKPCVFAQYYFTSGQTEVPGEPLCFARLSFTETPTTGDVYVTEKIEGVRTLAGEKVTQSAYVRSSSADAISLYLQQSFGVGGSSAENSSGSSANATSSFARIFNVSQIGSMSGKTIAPANCLQFFVRIVPRTAGTYDIACLQLEEGSFATPFEQRHINTEIGMNQRYMEKSWNMANPIGAISSIPKSTVSSVTGTHKQQIDYKTKKRTNATPYVYSSATGAVGYVYDVTASADVAAACINANESGFTLSIASATSGREYKFNWSADAEL